MEATTTVGLTWARYIGLCVSKAMEVVEICDALGRRAEMLQKVVEVLESWYSSLPPLPGIIQFLTPAHLSEALQNLADRADRTNAPILAIGMGTDLVTSMDADQRALLERTDVDRDFARVVADHVRAWLWNLDRKVEELASMLEAAKDAGVAKATMSTMLKT